MATRKATQRQHNSNEEAQHASGEEFHLLAPDFTAIPEKLRREARWVTWQAAWVRRRDGSPRINKVPYQCHRDADHAKADSTDPTTWDSFDAARDSFLRRRYMGGPRRRHGIGFVLTQAEGFTPYAAIDLDHCVDSARLEADPSLSLQEVTERWAWEIVERFTSAFWERSPYQAFKSREDSFDVQPKVSAASRRLAHLSPHTARR